MNVKKDWKTSMAGGLKAAAALLGVIGVNISPEQQGTIVSAAVIVYVIFSGVQAYFTADKPTEEKKVGTPQRS